MKTSIRYSAVLAFTSCLVVACAPAESQIAENQVNIKAQTLSQGALDTMIVAGGCFWCVESDFEKLPGVIEAVSGYTGGRTENPTYKQVSYNNTGHYEAAKITFDPAAISYEELLDFYWTSVDPTDPTGQFCDKGESYRTAIFARPDQLELAQQSLAEITETKPFSDPIVTPVLPVSTFYNAEDYHQDYYKKKPVRYKLYRTGCGRDARLNKLWGKKKK
jgi:peptide-methionine (S)-S-oxide reductase